MDNSSSPSGPDGSPPRTPEEMFALLGNETRIGILQALWDAFESGTGDNAVPYTELFDQVEIDDSGNFSYHLEKLTGPFVRQTDEGYELKQTGINVVRAVVAGTVIDDPEFGPSEVDLACPICDAALETTYSDELMAVFCTGCAGIMRWDDKPGLVFAGLVPPVGIQQRTAEEAVHRAVTYMLHQAAALIDGVCPHCAGSVEKTVNVCAEHDSETNALCPNCDRAHMAEVWLVCSTCKRSMFPPVSGLVFAHPRVTAFYHDHGIEHRFASWETVVRRNTVEEQLLSEDPLRMRFTIRAEHDALHLTLDDELNVVDVST